MNIICVKCRRRMKPVKIGVMYVEMRLLKTGTGSAELEPHRMFSADKYGCETCGAEVLDGFGKPMEHYEPDFMFQFTKALQSEDTVVENLP